MKNVIKSLSLAGGIAFFGWSVLIRLIKFAQTITITIPQFPFEDSLLIFSLITFVPYISVSIYDRLKVKKELDKNGNN